MILSRQKQPMGKSEISEKAIVSLLKQQIALLDAIEQSALLSDADWRDYSYSTFPHAHVTEERKVEQKTSYNLAIDFMKQYRDSVFLGITPSAMILMRIAEYFDRYLSDDSGKLSLDEAFKLKHRPKIGSPIKQKKWLLNKASIATGMWIQKTISKLKGDEISILEAAGIIINKWNLPADEESLKKEYKNLGTAKLAKRGLYSSVEEEIKDLEEAFESLTHVYKSGIIPKEETAPDKLRTKNALKEVFTSYIEQLGKK